MSFAGYAADPADVSFSRYMCDNSVTVARPPDKQARHRGNATFSTTVASGHQDASAFLDRKR